MDGIELHPDFYDFLKSLNSNKVEYLLVGGYAVAYHGYPRATGDMDIWVNVSKDNAAKLETVFRDFGVSAASSEHFLEKDKILRLGRPPVRIEVITGATGVESEDCYARRVSEKIDGVPVNIIAVEDLKANKRAAGRHKDLDDLENLP